MQSVRSDIELEMGKEVVGLADEEGADEENVRDEPRKGHSESSFIYLLAFIEE